MNWIDWTQTSLYLSFFSIAFNPTFWNIVAQNEYKNKTITRALRGNGRLGCYGLALTIFSLGMIRDTLYSRALEDQPHYSLLPPSLSTVVPALLFVIGQTFVLTSTWALGITGTFLGDYFGILMDHRVEGFPFNVVENPMYVGSTMCFAAGALWKERPAGLVITLFVHLAYTIALRYEGPFTTMIYANRDKRQE
ncbi:phospholipid methyltransferase [Sistotremastrum niveocremeum HHB9708]|uniref:Phosphatidyl-N-methylethanolamine N-methyltransferase n=2 Tax=Sistotremastraceae TaxID=3402574 RepID=A0A164NVQ9_9AGAM|nr:phospholipid methyltransferase [Sistotremastrum niveocremeum HHB9708]KZT40487.1 phospholipid methyltransferase [Sistotremastrum suecicum HHB10207 ss-3]